jgi:hypothetical protein
MEVKPQPHSPANSPPGIELLISNEQEIEWTFQRGEIFLASDGN